MSNTPAGKTDRYALFDSPIGQLAVAFNSDGVSWVDLADDEFEARFRERFGRTLQMAAPPADLESAIRRAIDAGNPGSLPLDLSASTDFQRRVLLAAAAIPRGETRTYSWLAEQVGSPKATRAVGSAMARNPVPMIIPCHRVVPTGGKLGKYSLGGPHNKETLLRHEGAIN